MAYKNKKYHRIQPLTAFTIIVAAALAVFLIGLGISRLSGAQNTTVILSDGEEIKFTGLFDNDGKPISGTLYYANGVSAEIDVNKGTVTYSDGTVYEGALDADYRRTGKGKITWQNGDVYEGELLGGDKHGRGKYTSIDGSIYDGEFKNNRFHGKGKLTTPDGGVYEGEFLNGVKSGTGSYKYSNGDFYEGQFKGDLRHGEGKYIWANGETYTGQFAKGNMNGYGTYTWPTGRASYTGYFENGKIVVVEP
jgi:hypothetical protein